MKEIPVNDWGYVKRKAKRYANEKDGKDEIRFVTFMNAIQWYKRYLKYVKDELARKESTGADRLQE